MIARKVCLKVWIVDILNSIATIRKISTEKKEQTFAKTAFFYSARTCTH